MHTPPINFLTVTDPVGTAPLPGYDRRLAIIVPYRDRAEHLRKFIPHLLSYFRHDKLDRYIRHSIHIIEQSGGAKFNRGKLKNAGFALTADSADYFCFHDVDYLPLWADYSWCESPTRLIWHGLTLPENYEEFFGAVVMFNHADFERANGYSNGYWGWGFEDSELLLRLRMLGISVRKRDGAYLALPHPHAGLLREGVPNEDTCTNRARFVERIKALDQSFRTDGLNTLRYELLESRNLEHGGQTLPQVYHHLVRI